MSSRSALITVISCMVVSAGVSHAADNEACNTVRIGDGGWTDNIAQNGLATVMLEPLGYEVRTEMLSAPMIFSSLKSKDIDVFLNSWSPSVDTLVKPYLDDKSVVRLTDNMTGAKWTLAVPTYVWEGGLRNFADIVRFKEQLDGKIYGIEPGNDANQTILKMIDEDAFGLKGFDLTESTEQAMLSQVERNGRNKKWMVFMGWAPHPMNAKYDMKYLDGGDDWFGPNQGGATIWTATRAGYAEECPNLGKFFTNLKFTVDLENEMMAYILDEGLDGRDAALKYIRLHPEMLDGWLSGVRTTDDKEAKSVVEATVGL